MCRLAHLSFPAVVFTLTLLSSPAEAQENCTEWSRWDPIHAISVIWSWRWCETRAGRYDVQWRFANTGTEEIEFRYELFTGMVSECGEQNRGRVFTRGTYRLGPGQRDERYSGRKTLRRTGFEQRFWLYLCVLRTETVL